jgi:hypothetical protein
MALQFGVPDGEINLCSKSIESEEKKQVIKKILKCHSVKQNKNFRAAIALMMLRRGSSYTGNSIFDNLYLVCISIYSNPISIMKLILKD